MTDSQVPGSDERFSSRKLNARAWIQSFRLKTLPLALSNTIMGSALAVSVGKFSWAVLILAALTTILLQVLSNMANDYGDFVNGKDTTERIGPKRMVQAGEISPKTMLRGIVVVVSLAVLSGGALIVVGTRGMNMLPLLFFALAGFLAIGAAIKYTVGKNPYGYRGLGDIFVFIFFGIVGVVGTYFLHTQTFSADLLLPAASVGLLSTGVLNMNNMRDYESDKNADKNTLVVMMGVKNAAYYHLFLMGGAFVSAIIYTSINFHSYWQWLFLFSLPLFVSNLKKVFTYRESIELYPQLGKLAMSSLLFTLSFGLGLLLS